jgi:hypothetical protein
MNEEYIPAPDREYHEHNLDVLRGEDREGIGQWFRQ